jgi:DNA-binding MarR family transcriptional regulator
MKIDDAINSSFSSPQQNAIVNIRITSNYLMHVQNAFVIHFGLTMPQFNILRILRGAKTEINVNTVKERMIEKSPNTTRLMDKLIDKGLIKRNRSIEDKRVVFVEITEKGLDVLSEIDGKVNVNTIFETNLSNQEADLLNNLLDKVRNSYE